MKPAFTIRREDIDPRTIAALDVKCFPTDEPIKFDRYAWWVARDYAGGIVAYAGASETPAGRFLARCGVLPPARGHGLQVRLIRARIRGLEVPALTYTHPMNTASMRSLVKCGFLPYRPEVRWAGNEMVYWMREP